METTTITRLLDHWLPEHQKRLLELAQTKYSRLWIGVVRRSLTPECRRGVDPDDVLQGVLCEVLKRYMTPAPIFKCGEQLNRLVCWLAGKRAIDAFRRCDLVRGESAFGPPQPDGGGGAVAVPDWREASPADLAALAEVGRVVEAASAAVRAVTGRYEGRRRLVVERWLTTEASYSELVASGSAPPHKTPLHTVRLFVQGVRGDREVQAAVAAAVAALRELGETPHLVCELDLTWLSRLIRSDPTPDERGAP